MAETGTHRTARSVLGLPQLGLGCAPLGNLYRELAEAEAEATVQTAWERGCRYFDTAPHYGVGLSEERLGRALAGVPRSSYALSTKVGRRLRPRTVGEQPQDEGFVATPRRVRVRDHSAEGIQRTLEASLRRLRTDHVDLLYLHDVEHHLDEVRRTGWPALAALRAEGTVRHIGFGMNHSDVLAALVAEFDVDVVLCAGRWTLLDHAAGADLLPTCLRRGTAVVVGGVYNSGLLADPKPGAPFDYQPASPELVARARRLGEICAWFGVPLRAAALRFPFGHPAVAAAVVGAASAAEVRENAELFGRSVPARLWSALRAEGLLPAQVPVPSG